MLHNHTTQSNLLDALSWWYRPLNLWPSHYFMSTKWMTPYQGFLRAGLHAGKFPIPSTLQQDLPSSFFTTSFLSIPVASSSRGYFSQKQLSEQDQVLTLARIAGVGLHVPRRWSAAVQFYVAVTNLIQSHWFKDPAIPQPPGSHVKSKRRTNSDRKKINKLTE